MSGRAKGDTDKVYLSGIGAYLPDHLVTNETISKLTGIDAEWIYSRTGIRRRYLSKSAERTSQLATWAVRQALVQSGVAPQDIQLLLVASSFPDSFPPGSTADAVKHKLGLASAHVVDINTPLSGFLYALKFARDSIASGTINAALVVGAESFSAASDLNDRRICYLFSDGAGAMLLTREKGFASVGPVVVGGGERKEQVSWPGPEWDQREAFTLYGHTVPGLDRYLEAALGELLGPKPLATPLHVISQQISQKALDENPRRGVQVFDGFTDCAYLLSSSLPVSLYHLLRWGEAQIRDRTCLFSADGKGTWCASLVDILKTPAWSDANQTTTRVGKVPIARSPDAENREMVSCSRDEAQKILEAEARKADPATGSLVCLSLKVQISGGQSRDTKAQVERETRTILTGSTRVTDSLLRLEGGTNYAILLREVDIADAQRLCSRLVGLLEEVDLAGEISVKVDSQVNALTSGQAPQVFAREVLSSLGPKARS